MSSWLRAVVATAAMLPALAVAATVGIVTIVDGDVIVVRDTDRFAAAEGLRLHADDIIITSDTARQARLELDDGQVIGLGPATRVLLLPKSLAREPLVYVAQGWVKVANASKTAPPLAVASARFDATRITGAVVVHIDRDADWLFVESGAADAVQRRDGKPVPRQSLKEGDSFGLRDGSLGSVSWAPGAGALAQIPRPFVDTLPRLAPRFANVVVKPSHMTDVSYADVAEWINGEPGLRSAFVRRLQPLAKQPRFRSNLIADMRLHPEWQRVLFPPPPPEPTQRVAAH